VGLDKPSYAVFLTYFKQSGNYYSEGNYRTECEDIFEIFKEVRRMLEASDLPGLCGDHSEFVVLIKVPEHPHDHPHLVIGGASP